MYKSVIISLIAASLVVTIACRQNGAARPAIGSSIESPQLTRIDSPSLKKVIQAAIEQTKQTVGYDPAFLSDIETRLSSDWKKGSQ